MKNKVLITSIHPPYDYRIDRHVRMLNRLNVDLTYANFQNKKNGFTEYQGLGKVKFIQYKMDKWNVLHNLIVVLRFIWFYLSNSFDYIFVQDPMLLFILIFVKDKKNRLILDVHENIELRSNMDHFALRIFVKNRNYKLFTPYSSVSSEFSKCTTSLMQNYPLKEDFLCRTKKNNFPTIVYVGMITNQNRQLTKTLDVFSILLNFGFQVELVGKLANDDSKQQLLDYISELCTNENFKFHGYLGRQEVAEIYCHSHFVINLLNIENDNVISPNKVYEAAASGNIIITDHYNIEGTKLSDFRALLLGKSDTASQIAEKVRTHFQDIDNLNKTCQLQKMEYYQKNLFWDKYSDDYNFFTE